MFLLFEKNAVLPSYKLLLFKSSRTGFIEINGRQRVKKPIFDASKINSLSKKECELLDKLYLVMINKMKLEFNFELYKTGKLTLLELRAKTRQYQDEAKEADIAYFNRLVDL